jgi:excisionase family DNA binding protein
MHPPVFSASDLANALGVHVRTVRRWVQEDKIEASRTPGGHIRITEDEFYRWVQREPQVVPCGS